MRGASTIVVDNGRIVSVTDGLTRVEPGVSFIDLSTKTVLPGLIDSHVHLISDRGGEQALLAEVRDDDPLHAYEAQLNGMKTLRAGFTTVRNLGDDKGVTMALREAVKRGWVQGPRIIDAAQEHLHDRRPHGRAWGPQRRMVARLPSPKTFVTASKAAGAWSAAKSTAAPT